MVSCPYCIERTAQAGREVGCRLERAQDEYEITPLTSDIAYNGDATKPLEHGSFVVGAEKGRALHSYQHLVVPRTQQSKGPLIGPERALLNDHKGLVSRHRKPVSTV